MKKENHHNNNYNGISKNLRTDCANDFKKS
jgi:hypothetical protein